MKTKLRKFGAWLMAASLAFAGAGAVQAAEVQVTDQTELNNALSAAKSGDVIQITQAGEYAVQTLGGAGYTLESVVTGEGGEVDASKVVLKHTAGAYAWVANCSGMVTVKNLTWDYGTAGYQYFQNVKAVGCVLKGLLCGHTENYFENCTFIQTAKEYIMWTYSANVTYDGCTFINEAYGKALNVYNEGLSNKNIVIKNCKFVNKGGLKKVAVFVKTEIPDTNPAVPLHFNVEMTGCTLEGNWPKDNSEREEPENQDPMGANGLWGIEGKNWSDKGAIVTIRVNGFEAYPNEEKPGVEVVVPAVDVQNGITQEIVEEIVANTEVAAVENTAVVEAIKEDVEGKDEAVVKVTLQKVETEAAKTTLQFEVAPYIGDEKVENDNIKGAVPFRLPLLKEKFVEYAKISHEGDPDRFVLVKKGANGEPYVDVALTSFSPVFASVATEAEMVPEGATRVTPEKNGFYVKGSEYYIVGKDGLKNFRDWVNAGNSGEGKTFQLVADVDLGNEEWYPIATREATCETGVKPFNGTFDGFGFTISGLKISTKAAVDYLALFSQINEGSVVKNLTVVGSVGATDVEDAAGVIGCSVGGTIENVTNKVDVVSTKKTGGVLVSARSGTTIRGCANFGAVTLIPQGGNRIAGGITAHANVLPVTIVDCVNYGAVKVAESANTGAWIGGIIGNMEQTAVGSITVTGCRNEGTISSVPAGAVIGGIIGHAGSSNKCSVQFTIGDLESASAFENASSQGGIMGSLAGTTDYSETRPAFVSTGLLTVISGQGFVGARTPNKSPIGLFYIAVLTSGGKDIAFGSVQEAVAAAKEGDMVKLAVASSEDFTLPVGVTFDASKATYSGTISAPSDDYVIVEKSPKVYVAAMKPLEKGEGGKYHVGSMSELNRFRAMVNGGNTFAGETVVLDNDIEFSGEWDSGIGASEAKAFAGTFDGQDHEIVGFTLVNENPSIERLGLFSNAVDDTVIKNLTMRNVSISGGEKVAGIVGYAKVCKIINCKVLGGTITAAVKQAAGIAGFGNGPEISGCEVSGLTIKAGNEGQAAGIIGGCQDSLVKVSGCKISACRIEVTGTEKGSAAAIVGGICSDGTPFTAKDVDIFDVTNVVVGVEQIPGVTDYAVLAFRTMAGGSNVITTERIHWEPSNASADYVDYTIPNGATHRINNFHPVAEIVGKGLAARYESLQAAIDAAQNGDTVKLLADIPMVLSRKYEVRKDLTMTLDLNGKVLAGGEDKTGGFAFFTNKGTLTIVDGSEEGTGKITSQVYPETSDFAGFYTVLNSGTLTLESGTIEETSAIVGGGANLKWALRNQAGSGLTAPVRLYIRGGKVISNYNALSNYVYDDNSECYVEISGGLLKSTGRFSVVTLQNAGASKPKFHVTITGGEFVTANEINKNENGNATFYIQDDSPAGDFTGVFEKVSGGKFNTFKTAQFATLAGAGTSDAHYLTGGLYVMQMPEGEIDEFYECVANDDPNCGAYVWKIVPKALVAEMFDAAGTSVGKIYSLQLAFEQVPENGRVELLLDSAEDITLTRTTGFTFKTGEKAYTGTITPPEGYEMKANGEGTFVFRKTPLFEVLESATLKGEYYTLADALAAVPTDGMETTIKVLADHAIAMGDAETGVRIGKDQNIVLDLNGKKIVGTATRNGTSQLIDNYGKLTVTDTAAKVEGKFVGSIVHGANPAWVYEGNGDYSGSYASSLIRNYGEVVINGGHLENASVAGQTGGAAFVVDNSSNAVSAPAKLTINDGELVAAWTAVRSFANNETYSADIEVNGGSITAFRNAILINSASGNSHCPATLKIFGGTLTSTRSNGGSGGVIQLWNGFKDGANTRIDCDITGGMFSGGDALFEFDGDDEIQNNTVLCVTGGVFNKEVSAKFIADGYVCVANEDAETKAAYPWTIGLQQLTPSVGENAENPTYAEGFPNEMKNADETKEAIKDKTENVTETLMSSVITTFTETNVEKPLFETSGALKDGVKTALWEAVDGMSELSGEEKDAVRSAINGSSDSNSFGRVQIDLKEMAVGVKMETSEKVVATLNKVSYDVKPILVTEVTITTGAGTKTETVKTEITKALLAGSKVKFRLAVGKEFDGQARVIHYSDAQKEHKVEDYYTAVLGKDDSKYVEIESDEFSPFDVLNANAVTLVCKVGDKQYATIADAIADSADAYATTIELTANIESTVEVSGLGLRVIKTNGKAFNVSQIKVPPEDQEDFQAVTGKDGSMYVAKAKLDVQVGDTQNGMPIRGFTEFPTDDMTADAKATYLAAVDEAAGNGNYRWQNYVLFGNEGVGVPMPKLIPQIVKADEGSSVVTIKAQDDYVLNKPVRSGVGVKFQLMRSDASASTGFVLVGEPQEEPVFTVNVNEIGAKTFWKIQTVFETTEDLPTQAPTSAN